MDKENLIINGRYLVLENIGKGGAGEVFLARDINNGCKYAIKRYISSNPNDRNQLIENIERELNVLKYTTHPVLPKIYNLFMENSRFFLVMEYVEGKNLKEIVETNGVLSEEQLLSVIEQVCSGLYYLHSLEPPIVYRDLKPSNIILCDDGKIKLIDFGIAKRYNKELIADKYAYGTKGFASPEQFGNSKGMGIYNTDIRSDIYAIGTTMFYLMTGQNYKRKVNSILISRQLAKIIDKCTKISPKDRYQSTIEVICDLKMCKKSLIRKLFYPIIKKVTKKL